MKLECIEDVTMNVTGEKAFTKGRIYNGYYYQGKLSTDPFKKILCAKNNFGERHGIKNHDNQSLDEFFNKHFRVVKEGSDQSQLSPPEIATMHQNGTLCESCGTYLGEPVGEPRYCAGCED